MKASGSQPARRLSAERSCAERDHEIACRRRRRHQILNRQHTRKSGLHGPFLLTRLVHFHAAIWHILSPQLTPRIRRHVDRLQYAYNTNKSPDDQRRLNALTSALVGMLNEMSNTFMLRSLEPQTNRAYMSAAVRRGNFLRCTSIISSSPESHGLLARGLAFACQGQAHRPSAHHVSWRSNCLCAATSAMYRANAMPPHGRRAAL